MTSPNVKPLNEVNEDLQPQETKTNGKIRSRFVSPFKNLSKKKTAIAATLIVLAVLLAGTIIGIALYSKFGQHNQQLNHFLHSAENWFKGAGKWVARNSMIHSTPNWVPVAMGGALMGLGIYSAVMTGKHIAHKKAKPIDRLTD